jgi:hypothetical protein
MLKEYMLTTVDNPYDPFEQFDSWFLFDVEKGYNTCSHLARVTHTSDDMSEEEIDEEIDRAMNEIIKYDFQNIYKKVQRNSTRNNVETVENV